MNYLAQRFLSGQNGFSNGSAPLAIVQAYCLAAAQPETYPDLTEEAQQWCRVRAFVYQNRSIPNIMKAFEQDWRSVSVPDSYQQAADGSYVFADVARALAGFGSALAGSAHGSSPPSGWPVQNLVSGQILPEYNIEYNPEEAQLPVKPLDDLTVDLAFYLFEKFIRIKGEAYRIPVIPGLQHSIIRLSQVSESWTRFIAGEMEKLDVHAYSQHSTETMAQYGQAFWIRTRI
jgi:hypothetical protein